MHFVSEEYYETDAIMDSHGNGISGVEVTAGQVCDMAMANENYPEAQGLYADARTTWMMLIQLHLHSSTYMMDLIPKSAHDFGIISYICRNVVNITTGP